MIMKPLTDRKWSGYSLDELQAQRALNDARIMVQKIDLQHQISALQNARRGDSGMFKKVLNALGYVDYAVLGISLFRRVTSIFSRLRRK